LQPANVWRVVVGEQEGWQQIWQVSRSKKR
jgi:hypothetical protein